MKDTEIPKNDCKGCQRRDEMLMDFAVHIDKQNEKIERLEKQLMDKPQEILEVAA